MPENKSLVLILQSTRENLTFKYRYKIIYTNKYLEVGVSELSFFGGFVLFIVGLSEQLELVCISNNN
jgi:hypothetical protein